MIVFAPPVNEILCGILTLQKTEINRYKKNPASFKVLIVRLVNAKMTEVIQQPTSHDF